MVYIAIVLYTSYFLSLLKIIWLKNRLTNFWIGHAHKYQTHFGGLVQTDPLSFLYLGTVKQASHKSRFIISLVYATYRILGSRQNMLNRKHYGHVSVRETLCSKTNSLKKLRNAERLIF